MSFPWHASAFDSLIRRRTQLPHALLLRGARGIGKLAFAEALAAALLCETPGKEGHACGQCTACHWMEQGSHPDFRRLEPENLAEKSEEGAEKKDKASTQISVEQVRSIPDFINVSSHRGGSKVILVHPAEALNVNAANALLKSLEEPPPGTYFLLVTHRSHQLLPTIKSRCQHIALAPPPAAAARDWLRQQGISDPDLALTHAGGAPLLAACFDQEYWQHRASFFKAMGARAFDALALAEQLRDHEPALVVGWLQKWTYDLASQRATGKVIYNPDFAAAIAAAAGKMDMLEITRFLRYVVRLQRIVTHPLNSRLFFEDLLLSYAALARGQRFRKAA